MSGPQIYRKKPIAVEVMRFEPATLERAHEIRDWMNKPGTLGLGGTAEFSLSIMTSEGIMNASPGDYIIKGVKGEFYPCKPDVFAETYDGPLE